MTILQVIKTLKIPFQNCVDLVLLIPTKIAAKAKEAYDKISSMLLSLANTLFTSIGRIISELQRYIIWDENNPIYGTWEAIKVRFSKFNIHVC